MFLRYTLVDSVTKKTVIDEPAANGPINPDVDDLNFEFALTSQYPTDTPIFYGSCPDSVATDVLGVLATVSQSEFDAAYQQELTDRSVKLRGKINLERDRRISGGARFNGHVYQTRSDDRESIAGIFSEATLAVINGAVQGDLRWRQPDRDFMWITANNSIVKMDAHTVIEFGRTVSQHKEAHIFAARAIKDASSMPSDFYDDRYWPEVPA